MQIIRGGGGSEPEGGGKDEGTREVTKGSRGGGNEERRGGRFIGKVDPNKQLKIESEGLLTDNLVQGRNTALSEILF